MIIVFDRHAQTFRPPGELVASHDQECLVLLAEREAGIGRLSHPAQLRERWTASLCM